MKRLTAKEEEIMRIFWENGPMFVRGLLAYYEDPKRIIIPFPLLCAGWRRKDS